MGSTININRYDCINDKFIIKDQEKSFVYFPFLYHYKLELISE